MYALNDVDLTIVGPVRADGPEGGPGPTLHGHMVNVDYNEHVSVCIFGRQANTVPSTTGSFIRAVDTPLGPLGGAEKAGRLSGGLVNVVDVSVGWVVDGF